MNHNKYKRELLVERIGHMFHVFLANNTDRAAVKVHESPLFSAFLSILTWIFITFNRVPYSTFCFYSVYGDTQERIHWIWAKWRRERKKNKQSFARIPDFFLLSRPVQCAATQLQANVFILWLAATMLIWAIHFFMVPVDVLAIVAPIAKEWIVFNIST